MTEERSTRDRVLDAFERLLVSAGSRAATLDAVAAEAGVSKGGLLYHFRSREALVDGMVERLREQAARDVDLMRSAEQGPVAFYLETSVDTGSDFDRALIAASRIAQEHDQGARTALADIRDGWFGVLNDHLADEALARTIQLIGDGLYFNDTTGLGRPDALGHVREVLGRLGH
ncbi:MAG: TetR/AcrR family transcriptional regulator [Aeromicrobium sp.]